MERRYCEAMKYADFSSNRHEETECVPSNLPAEVAAVLDQFPEEIRSMMRCGEIRFEVSEGPDGKTIALIHDERLSPTHDGVRLSVASDALEMNHSIEEEYRRRTKLEMARTVNPLIIKPFRHEKPRTGRNEQCPCGSGQKYKMCCIRKQA